MFPGTFRRTHCSECMTVILLFITLLSSGTNSMGTVTVGSHVPTFVLPDQNGNPFDISTVIGKKNLVIYFYPKDDTPGCIKEGCKFRDEYEAFKEADAEVIGISSDDAESHRKFATIDAPPLRMRRRGANLPRTPRPAMRALRSANRPRVADAGPVSGLPSMPSGC